MCSQWPRPRAHNFPRIQWTMLCANIFSIFPIVNTLFLPVSILLVCTFQFQFRRYRIAQSCRYVLVVVAGACCVSVSIFHHRRFYSIFFPQVFCRSLLCAGNSTIDSKRTNIKSCGRLRIGKICTRDQTRFKQSYSPPQ